MFSNEEGMIGDICINAPLGKSDYGTITFKSNGYTVRSGSKTRYRFEKADCCGMKEQSDMNWLEVFKNDIVEEQWTLLLDKITEAVAKYVPKGTSSSKSSRNTHGEFSTNRKLKEKNTKKKDCGAITEKQQTLTTEHSTIESGIKFVVWPGKH